MHLPEEKSFTPAPAGAHRAICIGFIDLGTQKTEYQGETKHKRQVSVRWEMPDEAMDDGRPFTISKRYTWSMSDRATLRKDLESWRGKPFERSDFGPSGFNVRKLLGAPCLLTIIHAQGNNGTYARLSGISPLPKGMEKPTTSKNAHVFVALEEGEFNQSDFDSLHDKLKETIRSSPEYREVVEGIPPPTEVENFDRRDLDDEIPF